MENEKDVDQKSNSSQSSSVGYAPALIQSYVDGRWFVSTIYRMSSVMLNPPANWYYETIVWGWDSETKQRTEILDIHNSGSFSEKAMKSHIGICIALHGV